MVTLITNPLLVGLIYFAISLILSVLGAWIFSFWFSVPNVWYFSLILVTTSVGIILPCLRIGVKQQVFLVKWLSPL